MKQTFFILLCSLFFLASSGQKKWEEAIKKGDSLYEHGNYGDAINLYLAAQAFNPFIKDSVKILIQKVYTKITGLQAKADKATQEALDSAKSARNQRDKADSLTKVQILVTLSNAPYKYMRLIRDGPKDPERIKNEQFDLKLISYCNHLDTLEYKLDSIKSTPDSTKGKKNEDAVLMKQEYDALKQKLYYNNDLYEKIFFAFSSLKETDSVLLALPEQDKKQNAYFNSASGNGYIINFNENEGSISMQSKSVKDTILTAPHKGQKFTSFALAKNADLLFCGTDDNYIYSYNLNEQGRLKHPVEIPMGIQVTALDFDEANSVIYFGTTNGDIGFIKYADSAGRKNQPVYDNENALGSTITGIDIFEYLNDTFLLATAYDGRAAVYKTDSNFLKPGNKFSGNFLPANQRNIKSITHAKFDSAIDASKNIVLQTTSKSGEATVTCYLWNPFAKTALEAYKMAMKNNKKEYDKALQDMMYKNKFY